TASDMVIITYVIDNHILSNL
ncbi:hypothetical protein MGSAQ_001797, partial [marine sediment metagenome]